MIELRNISYQYPDGNKIIEKLNLQIDSGECVLLSGKSGCGKTTIANLINNLIPRFYEGGIMSGNVFIDGKNTNSVEMYELSRDIGTVFQNPKAQFFQTNSDAEIVFGLENSGMKPENIRKRYCEVIDELQIQRLADTNMFSMSGGEKQIIAFASIYAMNPQVYILDEPTANIDRRTIQQVREIIRKLKRLGHTIIICEHRLYFLKGLVDRVLYIDQGSITKSFAGKEFFSLDDSQRIAMGLRSLVKPELKDFEKRVSSDNSLNICNLSGGYGDTLLFSNINLTVNSGEILGIIGDNGVGKTTFVRTIAGLHRPKKGSIRLNGEELNCKKRQKITSMVMQDVNYQLFSDTLLEECSLGNDCTDEEIATILKELNLYELKDSHPMLLSGGQKQRLVIANAILSNKRILIFDEPTSGLDYEGMLAVSRELKVLSEKGFYILIVSHDIEFINKTCTGIFEIKKREEN